MKTENLTNDLVNLTAGIVTELRGAGQAFENVSPSSQVAISENLTGIQDLVTNRTLQLRERFNITNTLYEHLYEIAALNDDRAEPGACQYTLALTDPLLLNSAVTLLYTTLDLDDGSVSYLNSNYTSIPSELRRGLTYLLFCLNDSVVLWQSAMSALSADQLRSLSENSTLIAGLAGSIPNLTEADELNLSQFLRLYRAINFSKMSKAMQIYVSAIEGVIPHFEQYCSSLSTGQTVPDVQGLIRIGGPGNNTYNTDYPIHIDCGGGDFYYNHPAGAQTATTTTCNLLELNRGCPFALSVDVGSYRDFYEPALVNRQYLGSGQLGMAAFVDLGGDDDYRFGKFVGRGALGLGLFYDRDGKDEYHGTRTITEGDHRGQMGVGVLGLGMFIDSGQDDDKYYGVGADVFGQGMALFIDDGGNDYYDVAPGYVGQVGAQVLFTGPAFGVGELGVAVHIDADGADTRVCEGPVNYGCFGSGSIGAGFFLDFGGDADSYSIGDKYMDEPWWPTSLGVGLFSGVGIFYDDGGNDYYSAERRSQGVGGCFGVGVFLDASGADTYINEVGPGTGWGFQTPCGLDAAYGQPSEPQYFNGGFGFFLDSAGADPISNPSLPDVCYAGNPMIWMNIDDGELGTAPGYGGGLDRDTDANHRCTSP